MNSDGNIPYNRVYSWHATSYPGPFSTNAEWEEVDAQVIYLLLKHI